MSELTLLLGASSNLDDAPRLLDKLVRHAEKSGASDVHIQMRHPSAEVAFRLDGMMTNPWSLPAELAERLCGRIKFLARLKTYQESLPQDGRIDKSAFGIANDIRVATYPTVTGEKIVLRIFGESRVRELAELEFPTDVESALEGFLARAAGMLLLTGPAGSGKTTTIYACLQHLARSGGRHIITVEDPVEQIIPGIMQTETNEARGLTFSQASRHLLRQDPQVLVIGEIRDDETSLIALRAALTGHMVISTLHAGSCQRVIERLSSFCSDSSLISSSLDLVINQRLVRRHCADCQGAGCPLCLGTGFHGRRPLLEFLRIDEPIRQKILARDFNGILARPTLQERAMALVQSGKTTASEIERVL
jgi:type II secretory ATPase GspE/PulE/Tfp pilus assembly ATPase PilB-like protein